MYPALYRVRLTCRLLLAAALAASVMSAPTSAQQPPDHYFHSANMPPGAVGAAQLQHGGPLRGYYQPVEIKVPTGARVALAQNGHFIEPQRSSFAAGMLIGQVYRVQVSNIPNHEGFEVYPTVELVNRLYTPAGKKFRFPIPIELTQEELRYALEGKFVTRVIYLENPETALPLAENRDTQQRYFDVASDQDPLKVADQLGRPMAIVRIGSRVPAQDGPNDAFLFGSPPWIPYEAALPSPAPLVPQARAIVPASATIDAKLSDASSPGPSSTKNQPTPRTKQSGGFGLPFRGFTLPSFLKRKSR